MTVTFDIPTDIEQSLREELGDLAVVAREALLVESYRRGALSLGRLAEVLRIATTQAPKWLAARGVAINYSSADLSDDERTLDQVLGDRRS